jgi:hypothetical protein
MRGASLEKTQTVTSFLNGKLRSKSEDSRSGTNGRSSPATISVLL